MGLFISPGGRSEDLFLGKVELRSEFIYAPTQILQGNCEVTIESPKIQRFGGWTWVVV
jgi:hypothetical protein